MNSDARSLLEQDRRLARDHALDSPARQEEGQP